MKSSEEWAVEYMECVKTEDDWKVFIDAIREEQRQECWKVIDVEVDCVATANGKYLERIGVKSAILNAGLPHGNNTPDNADSAVNVTDEEDE